VYLNTYKPQPQSGWQDWLGKIGAGVGAAFPMSQPTPAAPVAPPPPSTPGWVMPAVVGGAVLLLIVLLKRKKRA